MEFVQGGIDGEKFFGGKVFPKTLLPPPTLESPGTCDHLVELVKRHRDQISSALEQHRAILFRGFDIATADDFARAVSAFGWEEFAYEGAADRNKVTDRVYTANEAPVHVFLPFHHEMALIKTYPPKVFFCCLQAPPEGGATSIVPSDVLAEEMKERAPRAVERFVREGMRFVIHAKMTHKHEGGADDGPGSAARPLWQRMLKTDNQAEAEKRALETLACKSVKFNDDGSAYFNYGPMNPIKEFGGKSVWFNTILGYELGEREAYATFEDGSPLPSETTGAYEKILEENCVDVSWRKGDILLLDNHTAQHARRAGKPPRVVMVSLCN